MLFHSVILLFSHHDCTWFGILSFCFYLFLWKLAFFIVLKFKWVSVNTHGERSPQKCEEPLKNIAYKFWMQSIIKRLDETTPFDLVPARNLKCFMLTFTISPPITHLHSLIRSIQRARHCFLQSLLLPSKSPHLPISTCGFWFDRVNLYSSPPIPPYRCILLVVQLKP